KHHIRHELEHCDIGHVTLEFEYEGEECEIRCL
ncbi:Cadmium cobalt and zinc/H(+)-K(+) antiporter, partial [termite gut metagenome]